MDFAFIVGCARSGTSILGEMLAAHPRIKYIFEAHSVWEQGGLGVNGSHRLTELNATNEVSHKIREYFHQAGASSKIVLEKSPRNALRVPYVRKIFPDAKFIHIVRDGRDVACSLAPGCGGTDWWHLKPPEWQELMTSHQGALRCALVWKRVLEITLADLADVPHVQVRFEDLIANPLSVAEQLLDFLGLPLNPKVTQFCSQIQDHTAGSYHAAEQSRWYRDDHTRRIGRWQENLQSDEASAINQVLGPMLQRLGYTTSVNEPAASDVNEVTQSHAPVTSADACRLIAFYLPQFHPIPENDLWWGKGFTEWTNVLRSAPQFQGHVQPRFPTELGFYDLSDADVMMRQIELAKQHGIHGFCFHHYWFNGKRLLERPIKMLLDNKELDIPFCINYANENWTRRWDGMESDVLIAQSHSDDDDRLFLESLLEFFQDKRYIRVEGKPLLLVYRTSLFPNPARTANTWRKTASKHGLELFLCKVETFNDTTDPATIGFDAAVEFPPHGMYTKPSIMPGISPKVLDYSASTQTKIDLPAPGYTLFRGIMPGWDNTPRRMSNATVFHGTTPESYQHWLSFLIDQAREMHPPERRFVFINAWNEWGEGAVLEPCSMFGRGFLHATKNAVTLKLPAFAGLLTRVASNKPRPFWTVIIPVCNRLDYVGRCLGSVLDRDPGPDVMEIIVHDDCSDIDVESTVKQIGKGRVRYERTNSRAGLFRNTNEALRKSSGLWVHVLHDDDYVLPDFYQVMKESVENLPENVGVACCHYTNIHETDGSTWSPPAFLPQAGVLKNWLKIVSIQNPLNIPAVVIRRAVFERIGLFSEDLDYTGDWEFYIRSALHYDWWYQPQNLARYSVHADRLTDRLQSSGKTAVDIRRTIERVSSYLPDEVVQSSVHKSRELHAKMFLAQSRNALQQGNGPLAVKLAGECLALSEDIASIPEFWQLLAREDAGALRKWAGESLRSRRGGALSPPADGQSAGGELSSLPSAKSNVEERSSGAGRHSRPSLQHAGDSM